jgi:hypothetical protein
MRCLLAAALGILACLASAADRHVRHFLAVSATSYNTTAPGAPGQILLYDRDTATQFAQFDFPTAVAAPATTADGTGLYVVVSGTGVSVIDIAARAPRSFLPIPNFGGNFTIADGRLLVLAGTGIAALDLDATRILKSAPCPAPPTKLIYNGTNGAAYATMVGRQDLCVATPDLDPAPPIATPLGPHDTISAAVMIENNLLLMTTYNGGLGPYTTFALDLVTGRSFPVPSLDAVYPASLSPDDATLLYGYAPDGFRAYKLSFAPDGAPTFIPQQLPARGFFDDRFVYAGVSGSCSTVEGPVICSVGFRMLDPDTMTEVHSIILAQPTSFGLFGPRAIGLNLSAPYPITPSGSTASPPKRSRK